MTSLLISIYILGFILILNGIRVHNKKTEDFFKIELEFAVYYSLFSWLFIAWAALKFFYEKYLQSSFHTKIANFIFFVFIESSWYIKLNNWFMNKK